MSLLDILFTIFIMPLQLFFEYVFSYAQRFTDNPGLSIIVLSLTMNFLVLPLYMRADAIQAEQREIEKKLQPGISHIKKVYSGDEKMMMLQTYYRQNHYKPTDVFKESLSLLLQVPFFIAAYRFLSDLALLNGAALGLIKDLGQPDALIVLGNGMAVNILPLLMTGINIISCMIYTKGFPLKSKLQLYIMAGLFLILLYNSPAGLVFYWTLNNLFSLIKNIFFKLQNPRQVLFIVCSVTGIVLMIYGLFFFDSTLKRKVILVLAGSALEFPLILEKFIPRIKKKKDRHIPGPSRSFFILSAVLLSILTGGFIPSGVIASSPQEFVDIMSYHDPLIYVLSALCLSFGTFLIWTGVFYSISDITGKHFIELVLWFFCGVAVVDYLFFGTDLGTLFATLQFERDPSYSYKVLLINLITVFIVSLILYFLFNKFYLKINWVLLTGILTFSVMLIINAVEIERNLIPVASAALEDKGGAEDDRAMVNSYGISFPLDKKGRNVIVIMLDRAIGPYVPYIMNEKPELKDKFDGFTYYANSVSFGRKTNFGSPSIFGGYEYSPVEMNKRSDELLKDKQNEALKVMPHIFNENGYHVTVCDPPYANYNWIPDLTIFSDCPEIKAYNLEGMFNRNVTDSSSVRLKRNFFLYGVMKTVPLFIQRYVYGGGDYNYMLKNGDDPMVQTADGCSKAEGVNKGFMDSYTVLENLDKITDITDSGRDTFMMMDNNTTHEAMLLQEPGYEPAETVNNEEYDRMNTDRFEIDGKKMKMQSYGHYAHYETNMAAFIQIGKWLDYLRENGVYDNSRIILVSDHGNTLEQFDDLLLDYDDAEAFACLLMVKDFDSRGFRVSDEFMTTGDVPVSAFSGLVDDPVNPFTGKVINDDEKKAHEQFLISSEILDVSKNNGSRFLPSDWYSVRDNIWDRNNWRFVAENTVYTGEE